MKKAPKAKLYDVISLDGFFILIGMPSFKRTDVRKKYLETWKKRYEQQYYYFSNMGRIPLDQLRNRCWNFE